MNRAHGFRTLPILLLRGLLLGVVLLGSVLVGFGAGPASSDTSAPPDPTTDLESLERRLEELVARTEDLVRQAELDPRWRFVKAYQAYDAPALENLKRPVRAKRLVDLFTDELPLPPADLRREIVNALITDKARQSDPDLEVQKGQRKPRAQLALSHVVKLLSDDDLVNRKLAPELLTAWFGKPNDDAITQYDPVGGSRASWKQAERAWIRHIRR